MSRVLSSPLHGSPCRRDRCRGLTRRSPSRGFAVQAGSKDCASGRPADSEALQPLAADRSLPPDAVFLASGDCEDLDLSEADLGFSEEGWSADVVSDEDLGALEEGPEAAVDLRSDPMFSALPKKAILELERHFADTEKKEEQKTQAPDESSLYTRTRSPPRRLLRIAGGALKGRRLLSPRGRFVRPMMERVRSAIFNMLLANTQALGRLPPGSRWLDLYAGTGAVGLEALSRGCAEAHFVEMDPWVVSAVLKKNIDACGFADACTVRITKVEDYLENLKRLPQYSTGPFDFVTVCPPYRQVSYPELQQQLEDAGILHESSVIFMEYPRQLSHEIRDSIGGLKKIKDRQYGRTYLAVYGSEET